eukprot:317004-Chlamydomonas_euryale.AAC.7
MLTSDWAQKPEVAVASGPCMLSALRISSTPLASRQATRLPESPSHDYAHLGRFPRSLSVLCDVRVVAVFCGGAWRCATVECRSFRSLRAMTMHAGTHQLVLRRP